MLTIVAKIYKGLFLSPPLSLSFFLLSLSLSLSLSLFPYIYIYIYICVCTRVGRKVYRLTKILSWNVTKWALFFNIDHHRCCRAWIILIKSLPQKIWRNYMTFFSLEWDASYLFICSSQILSFSFLSRNF